MGHRAATTSGYLPIEHYALIGDCHSSALVSCDGSIDFFCPVRFDASALFCRLLDAHRGGFFALSPPSDFHSERRYIDGTNVLETTFSGGGARVRLTDFMPIVRNPEGPGGSSQLPGGRIVRRIEGMEGTVPLGLRLRPTAEFAQAKTHWETHEEVSVVAHAGALYAGLHSPPAIRATVDNGEWAATLHVPAGEVAWLDFAVGNDRSAVLSVLSTGTPETDLEQTLEYWREWSDRCSYRGPYRQQVVRSALTLKMLTYEPTGAVVAAPTTSLPEVIGGERNWDYRYTWLRDSSLILYALLTVGYDDEAVDFLAWLRCVVGAHLNHDPQIMYTIDGSRDMTERTIDSLAGYRDSRPVRVGNAASGQRQLDIYGEVLISAYIHYNRSPDSAATSARRGLGGDVPDDDTWRVLRRLVADAAREWRNPDQGIWEVRGGPQDFLYSKLMCWAAVDRGIRLAEEHELEADLNAWKATRNDIRQAIETRGYNEQLGAFVQAFGSNTLDAAVLAIPRIGFLPATDSRVLSTIDKIRADLTVDGLVYRYRASDGLAGGEGAFLLCTFWLIDALALAGRTDDAHRLFQQAVDRANDVGLFSEEIDPHSGAFLGNFPQGFTHLALIRAAVDLANTEKHGPETERHTEGERAHHARRAAEKDGPA